MKIFNNLTKTFLAAALFSSSLVTNVGAGDFGDSIPQITISNTTGLSFGSFNLSDPATLTIDADDTLSVSAGTIYEDDIGTVATGDYTISAGGGTDIFMKIDDVTLTFAGSSTTVTFGALIDSESGHCVIGLTSMDASTGGTCAVASGSNPGTAANVNIKVHGVTTSIDPENDFGAISGSMTLAVSYGSSYSANHGATDTF